MWTRGLRSTEGAIGLALVVGFTIWRPASFLQRALVKLAAQMGITLPEWVTFPTTLALVGVTLALYAIVREELSKPVTEGWLREALERHDFDQTLAQQQALECTYFLGDHRMWNQRSVEAMLSSKYVETTLRRFYREILNRNPEPHGFCQWGAMLFQAPRLERKRVEEHVRERIEKRKLQGWK